MPTTDYEYFTCVNPDLKCDHCGHGLPSNYPRVRHKEHTELRYCNLVCAMADLAKTSNPRFSYLAVRDEDPLGSDCVCSECETRLSGRREVVIDNECADDVFCDMVCAGAFTAEESERSDDCQHGTDCPICVAMSAIEKVDCPNIVLRRIDIEWCLCRDSDVVEVLDDDGLLNWLKRHPDTTLRMMNRLASLLDTVGSED